MDSRPIEQWVDEEGWSQFGKEVAICVKYCASEDPEAVASVRRHTLQFLRQELDRREKEDA